MDLGRVSLMVPFYLTVDQSKYANKVTASATVLLGWCNSKQWEPIEANSTGEPRTWDSTKVISHSTVSCFILFRCPWISTVLLFPAIMLCYPVTDLIKQLLDGRFCDDKVSNSCVCNALYLVIVSQLSGKLMITIVQVETNRGAEGMKRRNGK